MSLWDDALTPLDADVFRLSGLGARQGLGERPAVLVLDVTYNFTGDPAESILEAVRRRRNACGPKAWEAVRAIGLVLVTARAARVPVVYTLDEPRRRTADVGRWGGKNLRAILEDVGDDWDRDNRIVEPIAPRPDDLVVRKAKPSAFFGTPLASYLVEWRVDSLLVTGGTTSGCVRATVVDAFSHNYRVGIVLEGTFDRFDASHKISLFDMNAKYADVLTLAEAQAYLAALTSGATRPSPRERRP